ncbi:MAG: FimB/Mfa2 family fimbrial subunit [Prevotella sp.]|jgi:hypothetical protein|nr:FimB/Mfa2 family fimbrial subunit [Prevotella sp.]
MKKNERNMNKLLYLPVLALLSGILCCCVDEREDYSLSGASKENTVNFSVRVPGSVKSKTKALDEPDENYVKTIEVLLFDESGNYVYQPIYSNTIATDPEDSRIKTFTVKVPEGTYNMVIMANARACLSAALEDIAPGDSKASVIDKLSLANSGKWNADAASPEYIPIPMWGEISSITVSSSMPASNPVTLARMVSKIDVALTGAEATDNFTLESIYLYNYNDKGSIAPESSNWDAEQNIVTAPSVPSSANKPETPVENPLVYSGTEITTAGVSCINEIYTFEALAGSSSDQESNTCLVVGGTYTGDSSPSYYRIDFANTEEDGNISYLSLLRNHHYKVNIIKVSAPGLATPEEAFNSRPVNIEAEVIQWNDTDISDIVFDGQYMMGVSQGKFSFSCEYHSHNGGTSTDNNILKVTTDYPEGWVVEKIVDAAGTTLDWIEPDLLAGAAGDTDVKLKVGENTAGSSRTGYIHLKAGRLNYRVEIVQDTDHVISIVDDYYLMDGTQKSFIVKSATNFTVTVKENPNNAITLLTYNGTGNSQNGTPVYFNIIDDLTSPALLLKTVTVTISSPTGTFEDTDVDLVCKSIEIAPESNSYILSPNGCGIYIPVGRANKSDLGHQLGIGEAFTAELVWTDNINGIANNSNIRILQASGSGELGLVKVMPGGAQGNAVVAIKNTADQILWSWHIWVTQDIPSVSGPKSFMDRNLGAIGNTIGAVKTAGLLYQWGRKDPFPSSTKISSSSEPVLYDAEGGSLMVSKEPVSVTNNLANSVANPLVFYQSSSSPYDWYTNLSSGGQNNNLWGPATKSVYDPCPPGWRVPEYNIWTFDNWSSFSNYGRTNLINGGFYPAAGYRGNLGSLNYIGTYGCYWSASPNSTFGYSLYFNSGGVNLSYDTRVYGQSVRCVQE